MRFRIPRYTQVNQDPTTQQVQARAELSHRRGCSRRSRGAIGIPALSQPGPGRGAMHQERKERPRPQNDRYGMRGTVDRAVGVRQRSSSCASCKTLEPAPRGHRVRDRSPRARMQTARVANVRPKGGVHAMSKGPARVCSHAGVQTPRPQTDAAMLIHQARTRWMRPVGRICSRRPMSARSIARARVWARS